MAPQKRSTNLENFWGAPPPEAPAKDELHRAAAAPPFLTVSQLTDLIEADLQEDPRLHAVLVKGEISGLRQYPKAWYFTVKDAESQIPAVCWNYGPSREAGLLLKEGAEVLVRGDVTIYKQKGHYQLRVSEVQPTDRRGALFLKFEQTKKRLAAEGLFDESLKRGVPGFPRTIGVVTSTEGSVLRDIIQVIGRRFPHVRLLVAPSRVQGEGAEHEVVRGIEALNRFGGVDVIIVARGGGSIEDLWPFNEEVLARAVRASRAPIISAVGHQTDFTICDFAADLRAPTPSAAAEVAVPDAQELEGEIAKLEARLGRGLVHMRELAAGRLDRLTHHPALRLPRSLLESRQQMLDEVSARLVANASVFTQRAQARLDRQATALDVLSPLKTLARGYAIAVGPGGTALRRNDEVDVGDTVDVLLSQGELKTKVQALSKSRIERATKQDT